MQAMNDPTPDIAFEIWAPEAGQKSWQIVVDRQIVGHYRSQVDAVEYAKSVAREAWEEANLRTIVVRCKPDGQRLRLAAYGD